MRKRFYRVLWKYSHADFTPGVRPGVLSRLSPDSGRAQQELDLQCLVRNHDAAASGSPLRAVCRLLSAWVGLASTDAGPATSAGCTTAATMAPVSRSITCSGW